MTSSRQREPGSGRPTLDWKQTSTAFRSVLEWYFTGLISTPTQLRAGCCAFSPRAWHVCGCAPAYSQPAEAMLHVHRNRYCWRRTGCSPLSCFASCYSLNTWRCVVMIPSCRAEPSNRRFSNARGACFRQVLSTVLPPQPPQVLCGLILDTHTGACLCW